MKLAVITCGRSDYSIYFPLLKKLGSDKDISLHILAAGTHVSELHGYTAHEIEKDGFKIAHKVESLVLGDSEEAISTAMGLTIIKFSAIWAAEKYDLILCLGDRYEMFAAVASSVPFNIPVAHIHGGETTLGAIDNKFRHSITAMSALHFTTTQGHADRVKQIIGTTEGVYNVGALALDNLASIQLLSIAEFKEKYGIDLANPTVLTTFHPETVSPEKNKAYTKELIAALDELEEQVIVTMPNADTMGNMVRAELKEFIERKSNVFGVESLGLLGYYSCMEHCAFLLGNTSSGIIEAASFGKYVINIGDRQKGREAGANVKHVPVDKAAIVSAVKEVKAASPLGRENVYWNGGAADRIMEALKQWRAAQA